MQNDPRRRSITAAAIWALSLLGGAIALIPARLVAQETSAFSFGLWGDMPYARSNDGPKIHPLIADMNEADLAFSIFDGDFKDSGQLCDERSYDAAIARFDSLEAPAFYTPGDNEWTDCHRVTAGGYDSLERLAYLRARMFAKPESFGQRRMAFEQQGAPGEKFSENIRFDFGGIVFATMNVAGSNNNKVDLAQGCQSVFSARTPKQCEADNAEQAERDLADIEWMRQAFARARDIGAPGIVIVVQADPGFDIPETRDVNERLASGHDGYVNFVDALAREARAFAGQVLFVHGDSHIFRIDMPLGDGEGLIANFTRLETFGSPNVHWVMVTADPNARDVFAFRQMIVPGN